MNMVRISLAALATVAPVFPALAQGGGFSANMNQGEGGARPVMKMGKPSPEMVKKAKAARLKLMQDLKLSPEQKTRWDSTEKKYREQRSNLVKKLQGGEGATISTIRQLQGIGEKEKKEKLAFLSPTQQKVLASSPGGGSGMTIRTMGGPVR